MRIFLASDVHFEFHQEENDWLPPLPDESDIDVLVLAGDIGTYAAAKIGIERILQHYRNTPIIFVAGNHEFYGGVISEVYSALKSTYASHKRVHFLEQDSVELMGYHFIGCTLWSGLDSMGPKIKDYLLLNSQNFIYDFKLIKHESNRDSMLMPHDMSQLYQQSRKWLEQALRNSEPENTIVVTHYPPGLNYCHKTIPQDALSAYFQSNCQDLIDIYQPALWLYGHNHYSRVDYSNNTLLVSNQYGYPNEYTGYQHRLIIEKRNNQPWHVTGTSEGISTVMRDEL